jgi:hypothetical protein
MFGEVDIRTELVRARAASLSEEEEIIRETHRILRKDLFAEKKILQNLKHYSKTFEVMDEEDAEHASVFSLADIRTIAVNHRLKFLESKLYKEDIPYEAILKIKELNNRYHKELKLFQVLSTSESFKGSPKPQPALLFVKTNYDNFYLVHAWGGRIKRSRALLYWPLRRFENLIGTILVSTLLITLVLPTNLITLDSHAVYWSGYRAAAFFHLLIFNLGVTAYVTFAFSRNFSSSVWNRVRDFD